VSDVKKRLSTIPASPAVKTESKYEDKANDVDAAPQVSTKPARPTLGGRQSTRSVALAQRIREFEIVNQMLQVAMAQEGDGEDQEQVQSEAAITIAKLKADLSQTVDQEAVEAQIEAVEIPEASAGTKEVSSEHEAAAPDEDEVASLRAQLVDSQGLVSALTTDLEHLKDKVAVFSQSAEEESQKVQELTEAIRTEHAEKVESLKTYHKQEIDVLLADTKNEAEDKMNSHAEGTATLRSEIAEVKASLSEHGENAAMAESLRTAHATEMEELQRQMDQSKESAASSEKSIAVLRAELADAKASLTEHAQSAQDVDDLKSAHAGEMEVIQRQMKDAEGKASANEQELSTIRAELEEARTSLSTQQERSALDIKQQDHQKIVRELEEANGKKIDSIKQAHSVDLIESQSKLDQATQASTKASTQQQTEISRLGQVIEKLQTEIQIRDDANIEEAETRIAAIKEEHEKAMSAALDAAKNSSSGEVETLRRTLTTEFQTTIDELQQELVKAHEQASERVGDAQTAAGEQTHVLESKVRSLTGEMEGYKMQSQTFKQILSSSERETQEKDEEHAEAINKLQDDVATSVKKATEQQMKVMDISIRLDQEIAKRTALEKTHAQAIETLESEHEVMKAHHEESRGSEIKSLKEQHAETVKEYRSKEEFLRRQSDELQAKHESLLEQLRSEQETHGETLKDVHSKHEDALKEMRNNAAASQNELEMLKIEYANAGDSSQALVTGHKQELEKLQAQYDQAVRELDEQLKKHTAQLAELTTQNAAHEEVVKALRISHGKEIEALNAEHATAASDVKSKLDDKDAEIAKINARYAEMEKELEMSGRRDAEFEKLTIQNTNMATELKSIEASHSAYLEELRKGYMDEIKVAENAAKNHATELQTLKQRETDSNNAVDFSKDALAKDILALKSQHADQLTKLQSASKDQAAELNKLKMQRGLITEDTKANEAAHNREIKELAAQHSTTMEAMADSQVVEIERMKKQHTEALQRAKTSENVGEDSRAELIKSAEMLKEAQIKIVSLEAELALSSKTGTPRAKSPKKKRSSKSINGSGSPGLGHSKWAQAEPTTPLKSDYGSMRGGSGDDEPSLAGATDISSTVPTPMSAAREHNIEGQLAGMQEQLKHLDDIDAEMLEQHERMARTLNRVDDTTVGEEA
jgi:chromosome segregation ATPase